MDDRLISLNAAIDALNKRWRTCILGDDIAEECAKVLNALPPAQPDVPDTNVGSRATEADDLINRKDTIRAIEAEKVAHGEYTTSSYVGYEFAEEVVESMPSVQPGYEDAVSRKAAIDALPYLLDYEGFKGESGYVSKNLVRTMLKGLPPVTPKQPG